jgi:hypothetical protein
MNGFSYSHFDDGPLLTTFDQLLGDERGSTARLIACLAEVDARRLYAPVGYSSMYNFCIEAKGLSEDAAHRRIQAARLARKFPVIFRALAEGRLHLSGVLMLRDYLTHANADELIAAAAHHSKRAIEQMLADRFPRPDVPTLIEPISRSSPASPAPARVGEHGSESPALARADERDLESPAPARVDERGPESPALARVNTSNPSPAQSVMRPRVTPLSAERYALQVTISRATREKLDRVQELLGHAVVAGDIETTLDRALDLAIRELERRSHAATERPRRRPPRPSRDPRHIPAHVKRAVRKRDGDRCTFVSATGQRCSERKGLEYDHVEPVARGGRATASGVRLLCRTHNQHEADRTFGVPFMNGKRRSAARPSARARSDDARAAVQPTLGRGGAVG